MGVAIIEQSMSYTKPTGQRHYKNTASTNQMAKAANPVGLRSLEPSGVKE
jgi:hypothetical protein